MRSASPSTSGTGGSTSTGRATSSRRREAPSRPLRARLIPAKRRPIGKRVGPKGWMGPDGDMPKIHPHAEATYRVIPLEDGPFGVEVSIPENFPTTVRAFGTEAEAEAWIAE